MFFFIESRAIINLIYAPHIKVKPYEVGYRIVADFPGNYQRLSETLGDDVTEDGQVVILRGPCMEPFAKMQLSKLDTKNPPKPEHNDGYCGITTVRFNIHDIASVVKCRDNKGYNVKTHFAIEKHFLPRQESLNPVNMMPKSSQLESEADEFLSILVHRWKAISRQELQSGQ